MCLIAKINKLTDKISKTQTALKQVRDDVDELEQYLVTVVDPDERTNRNSDSYLGNMQKLEELKGHRDELEQRLNDLSQEQLETRHDLRFNHVCERGVEAYNEAMESDSETDEE